MGSQFAESAVAVEFLDTQLEKVRGVLEEFPEEKLWKRPAVGVVSLGNLVCHVAGSMREWFENGLGQGDWSRDRQFEFDRDGDLDKAALREHLDQTRIYCGKFLDAVNQENWEDERRFRDKPYSVREVLWHQVEHVAFHAGQAAFLRRMVADLPARP